MQNLTELIMKALSYQSPEEIPVSISFLPAAVKQNQEEVMSIVKEYPAFFGPQWDRYDYEASLGPSYRLGNYTDAWGCVWENKQEGMEAYVTGHPLPTRDAIRTLRAPKEDIGLPHGFMYLRLLDLRGFEEAMMDFAEECEELQMLIDIVCEYNVRQMRLICQATQSPLVYAGDDLGMQRGLAIGPEKWRKYLKPAFARIYDVCREYGKKVYMHTDGDIIEIMPDLIEAGVDIINPQYRANGLEQLVKTCKGRIPIMLDLDRQLLPFATPDQLREHVRDTIQALYLPEGGLGINLEIGMDVPMDNARAAIDELNKMRTYKG